jgi:hypothetical protein
MKRKNDKSEKKNGYLGDFLIYIFKIQMKWKMGYMQTLQRNVLHSTLLKKKNCATSQPSGVKA